ncbi:MAG: ribosomal protein S18-alanine N-acetyltransferase [Actinomycetota bacterium]
MSALPSEPQITPGEVDLVPMRRRHLRQVLRIESLVYPRPWSGTLFLQEIARKSDRVYLVARNEGHVIGYGGLMLGASEGHITTIAVDPAFHRRHIGMKLMLALVDAAIERGARSISLEVRKSNDGAQRMYELFGFQPVGIRRGYYVETGEDAIVMWVDAVDTPRYSSLLAGLRRRVAGEIGAP